jgi:hypothetical protein
MGHVYPGMQHLHLTCLSPIVSIYAVSAAHMHVRHMAAQKLFSVACAACGQCSVLLSVCLCACKLSLVHTVTLSLLVTSAVAAGKGHCWFALAPAWRDVVRDGVHALVQLVQPILLQNVNTVR